jgi:hypothetical protein
VREAINGKAEMRAEGKCFEKLLEREFTLSDRQKRRKRRRAF